MYLANSRLTLQRNFILAAKKFQNQIRRKFEFGLELIELIGL